MNKIKSLWGNFIGSFQINLQENENQIIALLEQSNGNNLKISESITILNNINEKMKKIIDSYEVMHTEELNAIKAFKENKKERIKKIINDPVFDKALSEINVDYEIVKAD